MLVSGSAWSSQKTDISRSTISSTPWKRFDYIFVYQYARCLTSGETNQTLDSLGAAESRQKLWNQYEIILTPQSLQASARFL